MICEAKARDEVIAASWSERWAERIVKNALVGLNRGLIEMYSRGATEQFGEASDLRASIFVNHPRFYRGAVLGGRLSIAESYFQGDWDCDDLTSLFRIFVRNDAPTKQVDRWHLRFGQLWQRMYHWWRANTLTGSRKNIAAHYDLGNDFYRLWLDATMAYSSGIFLTRDASLRDASLEKFDRISRKLDLLPGDEVVEIGTGWGGFALHAADRYGCHVTTTTISTQQHAFTKQRIGDAELEERIRLLQLDYRELSGQFDKLVSIEMIEAVGHRYLDQFFAKCSQLLRPDGSMVIQAIVLPERHHLPYLKSVDFIQRYIFPGGCLPSVASMLDAAGRVSDLRLVHVEDFADHYAETLRRWRIGFNQQLESVRELGYSESFIRLWNYYLSYCEAAFAERVVGVVQMQFDKPECRRDALSLTDRAAERATEHVACVNGRGFERTFVPTNRRSTHV